MTIPETEPTPKPKRKRKTKAEKEAERLAQARADAARPVDPLVWMLLGGLILFVAFWIWLDPVTFAETGQRTSIFQIIPMFLVGIFGQIPAAILLTVLGGVPLVWGIVGWLRKRYGKVKEE